MQSKKTGHLVRAAQLATLVAALTLPAAHAEDVIRIGIPVGLSGANSVVAPSVVQSAELAAEEINAKGGILGKKVVLEVADDGSGAAGAQKAFDSLIFQKKVNVLISMETSAALVTVKAVLPARSVAGSVAVIVVLPGARLVASPRLPSVKMIGAASWKSLKSS